MKKLVFAGVLLTALGGVASAADIPVKAPYRAPPPVPAWSWSGFYLGINGGYSVGTDDFNQVLTVVPGAGGLLFTSSAPNTIAPKGGFFGGQVGFNWQTGPVVFGVEADWQGASQTSTTTCGGSVRQPGCPRRRYDRRRRWRHHERVPEGQVVLDRARAARLGQRL